ncbi:MAG: hypothetical protein JO199_04065, partial [Candidatus Eremiobacteraeota bacterium]|nr:hypothetical protein [Candidatus Eremiobacteraeota bacterium]
MFRNAFWLTLIGGACVAIVAGFLQASVTTHPPPVAELRSLHALATLPPAAVLRGYDTRTTDPFAQDDVVVDRQRSAQAVWQRPRLAAVVGLCGASAVVEGAFLRLGFPLAFVLDPNASQAVQVARMVRDAGDPLFVQVDAPPGALEVAGFRSRFGGLDGIAARDPAGMPAALRGSGLTFFDERGDADAAPFAAARVALIARDVTADDRTGSGYVNFMLERAAAISRRA